MTTSELLKRNFYHLIKSTTFRTPNYDVIEFDRFLFEKKISLKDFIDIELITSIRNVLKEKYKNDSDCVK